MKLSIEQGDETNEDDMTILRFSNRRVSLLKFVLEKKTLILYKKAYYKILYVCINFLKKQKLKITYLDKIFGVTYPNKLVSMKASLMNFYLQKYNFLT